jgi:hypothetical protein
VKVVRCPWQILIFEKRKLASHHPQKGSLSVRIERLEIFSRHGVPLLAAAVARIRESVDFVVRKANPRLRENLIVDKADRKVSATGKYRLGYGGIMMDTLTLIGEELLFAAI